MIFKITGIMLIIICCSLSGIKASDRLKKYSESCELLEETVNRIGIMIRYKSLNIYGIISELKKSESLSGLEFIKNLPDDYENFQENFSDLWCRAVNSDSGIGDDEKKILTAFGETFGSGDIKGELSEIEMLIENLRIAGEKRRREYEKKGRLYRSVGILSGVMTGILIL